MQAAFHIQLLRMTTEPWISHCILNFKHPHPQQSIPKLTRHSFRCRNNQDCFQIMSNGTALVVRSAFQRPPLSFHVNSCLSRQLSAISFIFRVTVRSLIFQLANKTVMFRRWLGLIGNLDSLQGSTYAGNNLCSSHMSIEITSQSSSLPGYIFAFILLIRFIIMYFQET